MTKRLNIATAPDGTIYIADMYRFVLEHPEWIGPFTTCNVEGHGDPQSIASAAEQVRGHAERLQVEILIDDSHAQELIDRLRADLPSHEVTWWLSPVTAMGSLA